MEKENVSEQKQSFTARIKKWAKKIKKDVLTLYFALKHPSTPLYAKVLIAIVVGYALSPIDFIPDFVPILGYLDDVILLPLGIALVIMLIPPDVLNECRKLAQDNKVKPKIMISGYIIVLIWVSIIYVIYLKYKQP